MTNSVSLYIADRLSQVNTLIAPEKHPWLSDDELKKIQRFKFEEHQQLSYLSKLVLRWGLTDVTGETPESFCFSKGKHGKPYIENRPDLHFNLSHTKDIVVLAVSQAESLCRLGVDVEQVNARRGSYKLANRFFSDSEKLQLLEQTPWETAGVERFNQFWTLKEAFIKVLGTGLATPLKKFAFDLTEPNKIGLSVDSDVEVGDTPWHFHLFKHGDLTRIALGFQSSIEHPVEVTRLHFDCSQDTEQPKIEGTTDSEIAKLASGLSLKL